MVNSAYPAIHRSLSCILARSFRVQTGATGLNHVLPLAGARRMPGVRCLRDHGTRGNKAAASATKQSDQK
jgi:hypothetical protein